MKSNVFKEWIAPIVVLVAICGLITYALAATNSVTAPIIAENEAKEADQNRIELLPKGDSFEEYKGDLVKSDDGNVFVKDVYSAKNGEGVVMTVVTKSFGGALTEMIGIDKNGEITGVKVGSNNDTPGLGTKAHEPTYLKQYQGVKELTNTSIKEESKVQNQISYITGATISSNAVYYGVYEALQQFETMGGVK